MAAALGRLRNTGSPGSPWVSPSLGEACLYENLPWQVKIVFDLERSGLSPDLFLVRKKFRGTRFRDFFFSLFIY